MADEDINIHINTPGSGESKRELDKLARAAEDFGKKVASSGNESAESTDKSSKKLSAQSGILTTLKRQVLGLAGAWLGMQGVQKILSFIIEKLERVKKLQDEIHKRSLELAKVGQGMEIQAGTVGEQKEWTKKAIDLQKAGGLENSEIAKKMMVGMDITYSSQGGIENPEILDLGKKIAPFVGAAGMDGGQVGQLFEFAGTAGIEPTEKAWMSFLAKLHKGYTSAKTDSVGDFLTGLQGSGTGFIGQGGSLDEAISMFAAARSVTQNESVASTLFEQATRFSSGAYEKPRKAIEESLGVEWGDMNMDQRMFALLKHIERIPESSRTQTMVEQGFEPGLASAVQKMVTPEAMSTMRSTRQSVRQATPELISQQMKSYLESDLGMNYQIDADRDKMVVETAPKFAPWKRRIKEAQSEHDNRVSTATDDPQVWDGREPFIGAFKQMSEEITSAKKDIPEESSDYKDLHDLQADIMSVVNRLEMFQLVPVIARDSALQKKGVKFEQRLGDLLQPPEIRPSVENTGEVSGQGQTVINNFNYHQDTIYHPKVGRDSRGPRFSQE